MATGAKKAARKRTVKKKAAGERTGAARGTSAKKAVPKKGASAKKTGGARKAKRPAAASGTVVRAAGILNIDYSRCRGCGGCADVYPKLFEMRGDLAWVINAGSFDPKLDGGALSVCPYYAITLE